MFATRALWLVVVGLGLTCLGVDGVADAKDKDKDKKEKKKFEVPKDAVAGTVKSVDMKAPSFTISVSGGKDRTFGVTKETEFWGPLGGDRGTGPKGLSDDCMAKGYEIKVMPTKDGKSAKDVFLPNRKK
jgi:hypothetical protein